MDNRPEISQACDRVCRRATFLHNRTVRRQYERGWLRAMKLDEAALAVMVNDVKRTTAAQRERTGRRRYLGGMKALGMRSRIPGIVKLVAR
jgi:hypothetical protein